MRNDPATLRCGFVGNPTPQVTWYRDGEALEPRGQRLVLPDGALFFLRVSQGRGRNGGDAGTYWCVARNAVGVARSRNATLTVACKSETFDFFDNIFLLFSLVIFKYYANFKYFTINIISLLSLIIY